MDSYTTRIRDLREEHNLTQKAVADYLGTSQTMYARYERGANELPIRHLIRLCNYYHVSSDYVLGLSDQERLPSATGSIQFKKPYRSV